MESRRQSPMSNVTRIAIVSLVATTTFGCGRAAAQTRDATAASRVVPGVAAAAAPDSGVIPSAARIVTEADGNDDEPRDVVVRALPASPRWTRVGVGPRALRRICDLTPLGNALYTGHANTPLGSDGATILRYDPDASPHFRMAFDWNRRGQPTAGGGAGQGFLRIRSIGGRLFVPDTDPPHAGFALADGATEGYVFVSNARGEFAPPRGERFLPPTAPDASGLAGAAVLPRAYHVLDVIQFREHLYASTGSAPPRQRAWFGPSPGALHVANPRWSRWTYGIDYPFPWANGVWRLTYMVRFHGRLYAGIQDYDWRDANDYVVFTPDAGRNDLERRDVHPTRATRDGGSQTLRWYVDGDALYWITWGRDRHVHLRVTRDGDAWTEIALPDDAGAASDIVRFRGHLLVLTEWGLHEIEPSGAHAIARITAQRSPFVFNDIFCAAPLGIFRDTLYAGGQRDGALYRLDASP